MAWVDVLIDLREPWQAFMSGMLLGVVVTAVLALLCGRERTT